MMNLFKLSEQIKDFSKDQLVQEMKMPSGSVPQYLILSELQRRTRMEQAADGAEGGQPTTVAEDAVAAAGVPQAGLAGMARAMAPQTDMTENSGIAAMAPQPAAPVERMQEGGEVEGPNTARLRGLMEMQRAIEQARAQTDVNRQRILRAGREDEPRIADVEPRASDVEVPPAPMTFTEELTETQRRGDRPFPMLGDVPEIFEPPTFQAPSRPGPVQGPNLPRQPVDPGEFYGLPDYMTDQYAEPPEDIRNPLRVLFGDEAIDAIPPRRRDLESEPVPQDTETPLDEQDVDDFLPPPREAPPADTGGGGGGAGGLGGPGGAGGGATDLDRLYEQDRWLSLARFGLGLMSSREPTFGGAIGEAGQSALDYMAGARESMMDRRMQDAELDLARQRLALSAAGGGGGERNLPVTAVGLFDDQIEALQAELTNPIGEVTPARQMQIQQEIAQLSSQRDMLRAAYFSQFGPGMTTLLQEAGAPAPAGPRFDVTQ